MEKDILEEFEIKGDKFGFAQSYGYGSELDQITYWKEKYENEAEQYWDKFYKIHGNGFFKDRHWLNREFEELTQNSNETKKVLEVGCGTGATIFPCLKMIPNLFFYACDFSKNAINCVLENEFFSEKTCKPFVFDLTCDQDFPDFISENSIDLITVIFVLSAISPEKMIIAVQKFYKVLKTNGTILFRDYCVNDLSEKRFDTKNSQKLNKVQDNFRVRGDGTRAYFFTLGIFSFKQTFLKFVCNISKIYKEFLEDLFTKNNFKIIQNQIVEKKVENLKEKKFMDRLWIQGKYQKMN